MDVKIERKKGIRGIKPKYWAYAGIGLAVIIAIIWILTSDLSSTYKADRLGLTIGEVTEGQFDDFVRIDGHVLPISQVQISPEEGGIVVEKVVEEGAMVHKGDVIIILRNSALDLQILNAEAELAEKQNILRNTQISMEQDRLNNRNEQVQIDLDVIRKRRAYEQKERLYKEHLIAKEEYLQAKEDYELALRRQQLITQRLAQDSIYRLNQMGQMEENLENMQTNVVLIRQRKDHLNITAPVDGELGLLDAELGQNITAGQKVGQINVLSDYKVEARIDERSIDRVHVGLPAILNRNGQKFNMKVHKVYPEVREGKFRVDFVFDGERPDNIRMGQTYYLNLQLGQASQAILIPKGAFYASSAGNYVYVLDKNERNAYRRNVRLGRQNPQYYEVLEGLEPGERVIINGYEPYGDAKTLVLK